MYMQLAKTQKTETVSAGRYSVEVGEATLLMGMQRTRLKIEGNQAEETDIDRRILRLVIYPDLVAATREAEGFEQWPPDFETFLELPEAFASQWEQAVYLLNPHWLPGQVETGDSDKKKQPSS